MAKNTGKGGTYRTMVEFEKRFFPRSFEKKLKEDYKDAHDLGSSLAEESLRKVRTQLAR